MAKARVSNSTAARAERLNKKEEAAARFFCLQYFGWCSQCNDPAVAYLLAEKRRVCERHASGAPGPLLTFKDGRYSYVYPSAG